MKFSVFASVAVFAASVFAAPAVDIVERNAAVSGAESTLKAGASQLQFLIKHIKTLKPTATTKPALTDVSTDLSAVKDTLSQIVSQLTASGVPLGSTVTTITGLDSTATGLLSGLLGDVKGLVSNLVQALLGSGIPDIDSILKKVLTTVENTTGDLTNTVDGTLSDVESLLAQILGTTQILPTPTKGLVPSLLDLLL